MKGFPKGWKPKKEKFRKAPTPPPGHHHGSLRDYERKRQREEDRELVEEGMENFDEEKRNREGQGEGNG